mmetsp:Transcript_24541/g.56574  ORF Transcript_24541/g.56574 Transcript_24541/m.56574 type:complete len:103 (+) Transcript_24541:650-958(+)
MTNAANLRMAPLRRLRSCNIFEMLFRSGDEAVTSSEVARRAMSPPEMWHRLGNIRCKLAPSAVLPLPGPPIRQQMKARLPAAEHGSNSIISLMCRLLGTPAN